MSENETQEVVEESVNGSAPQAEPAAEAEEISYHAVEKEGEITAIWEMQGKKHLRTISARSGEGQKILSLFTSEIHETDSPPIAEEKTAPEEAEASDDSGASEEASA